MELIEGQTYWTCANTVECGYYEELREPHEIKVRIGRNGCFYGHAFNEVTGEVDLDMNATIVATRANCFLTRKEANDYYTRYLVDMVAISQERLTRFEKTRRDY